MKNTVILLPAALLGLLFLSCRRSDHKIANEAATHNNNVPDSIWFEYSDITGIGYEAGVSRRDPGDIIKAGDTCYIWYTKILAVTGGDPTPLYPSGYYGTIWYAVSGDGGRTWTEKGQALGPGEKNTFDSHAVFTPNILFDRGKYYLYYTGVKRTPGNITGGFENNSVNDFTAIGLAVSGSPEGPFVRFEGNPVLQVSKEPSAFDSYRVDDAALMVKDGKYRLYYKGRSMKYGKEGPRHTMMGVALGERPEGPFRKAKGPLLGNSHEVLVWNGNGGVFAMASISGGIEFSPDGRHFDKGTAGIKADNMPSAPGLYRPHLTDHSLRDIPGWGISMNRKGRNIYLVRFFLYLP